MVIFAHRGIGFDKPENSLESLEAALKSGYSIEADLRIHNGGVILGHDPASSNQLLEFDGLLRLVKKYPRKMFALHLKEKSPQLFCETAKLKEFSNILIFATDFAQKDFIESMWPLAGKEALALYVTEKNPDSELIKKVNYLWLDETKNSLYDNLDHFKKLNKRIICCSPELYAPNPEAKLKWFNSIISSNPAIFGVCTDFAQKYNIVMK